MLWPLDCFVARAPRNDGWVAADSIDSVVIGRRLGNSEALPTRATDWRRPRLNSATLDHSLRTCHERPQPMLQAISALKGFAIEASDGRMGTAVDFLFDDASWRVRWLVVDCGKWLKERKVLIHPSAVSYTAIADEEFNVELTKAQVEASPELLEHQPVSRKMEGKLYEYYGWDPLWDEAPNLVPVPEAM